VTGAAAAAPTGTPAPLPDMSEQDARAALDAALLLAHEVGDRAMLVRLYAEAAAQAGAPVQTAFYLTHAYVFALEAGLAEATALHAQLRTMGCEA